MKYEKPPIKSWSFSRLSDFETCAYRAKLKVIDRLPEPERPLKPGQTEHANDRGTRIHTECENYVKGAGEFPIEAKHFKPEFNALQSLYAKGLVSLEGEWGFDRNWKPCDYKVAWLRVKLDVGVLLTPKRLVVIDHKTGRKFGNEIKHSEQATLYGLTGAIRYPQVTEIDTELWYLDQDELTHDARPVSKWLYFMKLFNNRGLKMTNATVFEPNPSKFACQYCPYRNEGCEYAYREGEKK